MRTNRQEFSKSDCEFMWARSGERCEMCGAPFAGRRPEYHHIIPCALGGNNKPTNGLCICKPCHRRVTKEQDRPRIVKAKRTEENRANLRPKKPWPKRSDVIRRAEEAERRAEGQDT